MALVSGRRSSLNPDAPLFIPAAFRQVEDFSPEWWQLVTSSTWYHDYWLSQQQDVDGFFADDYFDNIADLLPDTCDVDVDVDADEDFMSQYEEFIRFGAEEHKTTLSTNGVTKNDMAMNAEAMKKNMKLVTTFHGRVPKVCAEPAKYPEKAAMRASPRYSPRAIQQPR